MHSLIILEVARQPDGSLPDRLLELAYRASQRGCIMLLLNGVSPFEVDAALDPLVGRMPLDIPGVVYRDVAEGDSLSPAVTDAAMIFLSPGLARRCPSLTRLASRRYARPAAALPILERLGRPTSLRELAGRAHG
ncbi:hypothetical protein [Sphingobium cloacae]|uniref:Uncharacterized protein n=1 Tax=Sphingobium cloacae TaxID=120107 RepID=A0A1E1F562_9SPHN|nr:hypothetical protein [Sphingobium cloacae]BAV65648.1 hypothetical protein SCLO_1026080 [Sphingobium cloacae]